MRFSYSGTTPATIVQFHVNPAFGDWTDTHRWKSPSIQAAAKEDHFALDKGIVQRFHSLHLSALPAGDRSALLIFLEAVDGIANTFDYTDSAGVYWMARIWNAKELKSTLVSFNRSEITIELLVTAHPNLIVNGSLWTGASGATPPDGWTAIHAPTFGVSGGFLSIARNTTDYPAIHQAVTSVAGRTYKFTSFLYSSDAAGAADIDIGKSGAGSSEYGILIKTNIPAETQELVFVSSGTAIRITLAVGAVFPASASTIGYFGNVELIDAGF